METEQKQSGFMNNKVYIIGAIVLVVIIGLVSFMMMRGSKQQVEEEKMNPPKQAKLIPTVDSSVKVSVNSQTDKRKFDMSIEGIPANTTSLEYEISYDTANGGIQGFNSPVDIKSGQTTYEKKGFLLGSCSTGGKCTYDELAGPLSVSIKFIGSYGERLFQEEFEL